jgi:hypothetical protein
MAERLRAFGVPASDFPRAKDYVSAVLAAPPVKAWMDQARALPPMADY